MAPAVNETLSTRLIAETVAFFENNFQSHLASIDLALVWAIRLVLGLLLIIPALRALLDWGRKSWASDGLEAVYVCSECREEVPERTVRCPHCDFVFPSSLLRAVMTLVVLALAYWTAAQRDNSLLFGGLLAFYGSITLTVLAYNLSERMQNQALLMRCHALFELLIRAITRLRELWVKAEWGLRLIFTLSFYGILLLGLRLYGVPSAAFSVELASIAAKSTFLFALLTLSAVFVLINQLWRFQGFSVLALSVASLLFFTGMTLVCHGLHELTAHPPVASPEHWMMSAQPLDDGRLYVRYHGPKKAVVTALVKPLEPQQLQFSFTLLRVKKFSYRRYFLKHIDAQLLEGQPVPGPLRRSTQLSWWQPLAEPNTWPFLLYSLAASKDKPQWFDKLEIDIDPQQPRVWRVPMKAGVGVQIFVDDARVYYKYDDSSRVIELERS